MDLVSIHRCILVSLLKHVPALSLIIDLNAITQLLLLYLWSLPQLPLAREELFKVVEVPTVLSVITSIIACQVLNMDVSSLLQKELNCQILLQLDGYYDCSLSFSVNEIYIRSSH
jgi:hypothetical protein